MAEPAEDIAVRFDGLSADSGPAFLINIVIPERGKFDRDCTLRQQSAVNEFYCSDALANDVTYSQASALLSYRQYALACANYWYTSDNAKGRLLYARLIAAHISSQPEIAGYAVARSNARFRSGSERSYVTRTKYYFQIEKFCRRIKDELELNGIKL